MTPSDFKDNPELTEHAHNIISVFAKRMQAAKSLHRLLDKAVRNIALLQVYAFRLS